MEGDTLFPGTDGDEGDTSTEGVETIVEPQKITIDGQEYTPDEVKAGMLRQDDYTRKTQAIAEKERELTEREAALADPDPDPDPDLDDDAGTKDPRVKALAKKVEAMERSAQADRVNRIIADLRTGKDGDLFTKHEDAIVQYAQDNSIYNPKTAFNAFKGENMHLFTADALEKAKQEGHNDAAKRAAASSEDQHGGTGVQSGEYKVDPQNIKQGKFGAELKRWQQSKA